ncbi:MAG: hypothetical protein M3N53_03035 [Actinomycetota bacterium]|nr:hypothetical protein [Actinomycetota bacterium]
MTAGVSGSTPRAEIVGASAGRIRLRVVRGPKSSAELAHLAQNLAALREVADVEVRPHSASVVIEFDPAATATVEAQLLEMGIRPRHRAKARPRQDPASTIRDAASAIDRAVARRVRGANLRLLLPLTLGLLSVRQFVRGDDRLTEAPWYLLAMYAADSFSRLQDASSPGVPTAGDDV